MRATVALGIALTAAIAAGCGGSDEPNKKEKDEVMKVEDTAFGPLVGAPKKAQDRTDAAAGQYRESMNERLEEGEGGGAQQDEPSGD